MAISAELAAQVLEKGIVFPVKPLAKEKGVKAKAKSAATARKALDKLRMKVDKAVAKKIKRDEKAAAKAALKAKAKEEKAVARGVKGKSAGKGAVKIMSKSKLYVPGDIVTSVDVAVQTIPVLISDQSKLVPCSIVPFRLV